MAAAYLALLVLQLNPLLPLREPSTWWLVATMLGGYGVHLAVALLRHHRRSSAAATESLSPGWFSVQLLAWLCAGASTAAAVLMWLNLRGFRVALDDDAAQRMTLGAHRR